MILDLDKVKLIIKHAETNSRTGPFILFDIPYKFKQLFPLDLAFDNFTDLYNKSDEINIMQLRHLIVIRIREFTQLESITEVSINGLPTHTHPRATPNLKPHNKTLF